MAQGWYELGGSSPPRATNLLDINKHIYHSYRMNATTPLKPANECPKLEALAAACNNGACNPSGIIISLAEAIREIRPEQIADHPAVTCIIGQLAFLTHVCGGPPFRALTEVEAWQKGQ